MKFIHSKAAFIAITSGLTLANWFIYSSLNWTDTNYVQLPVTVSIVGAIKRPGIYKLPAGSLVIDLVRISGGLDTNVDQEAFVSKVNHLSVLDSYQTVLVPAKNTLNANSKDNPQSVNLNTASEKELQNLPGIGEVLAKRIIESRPISSEVDLAQIQGMTKSILDKLANLVSY